MGVFGHRVEDFVVKTSAAIVVVLAAIGLSGWFFNLETLISVAHGLATMKVNTAIGLLLGGTALLLENRQPSARRTLVTRSIGAVLAVGGVLSFVENLTDIDFHIDQLLLTDTITPPDQYPGRMSAISALNFCLVGVALWTRPHVTRAADIIFSTATALGLISTFLAFLGYLYGAPPLYQPLAVVSIAVNTTAAFLALFVGLLALRPDLGWIALLHSPGAGGVLFRRVLPMVVVFPPVVGWLRLQGELLGYYDTRVGVSLFAAASVILPGIVLSLAAYRADRLDAERGRSRAALSAGEANLKQSEQRYRKTFDIAPVGIIHVSMDGKFLMVNDFFCRLLGYRQDELLLQDLAMVTGPEDVEEMQARLNAVRAGQSSGGRITRTYQHKDGSAVWCDLVFTAAYGEGGEATHMISIVSDISARVQSEDRQRQLSAQLQQAQKMEAIGQLTGGMAHDFNNLLAVVLGNLDFLEEKFEPGSDELELTQAAIQGAVQGAELVRRLLAFARRQPLAPTLTEIGPALEGAGQLFRRTLGETIALEVTLGDDLWPVLIDVAQLESSLLNLAVNARDAMPDGGSLTIEARNVTLDVGDVDLNLEAVPGDYVVISLSDTGTGMPPDIIARVFEPFFTTKGLRGTGLGLSMVHGFVKQSGGHTRIYSELGHGTTIRIYLPRAEVGGEGEAAGSAEPLAPSTGSEAILVVEDNAQLRDVVMRRLQALGYRTIPATDGWEGLAIIRGGVALDLLFTDVVMAGGMDGRTLAEAARRLRPGIKVLFTSGFTAAAASAAMAEEFGSNLLTKPYRREDLARQVRAALDAPE